MKILTTLHDIHNLEEVMVHADGLLISFKQYSKTYTMDSESQLDFILKKLKDLNKESFLQFNRLYTDKELNQIKTFLQTIDMSLVTGYIISDLGLLSVFKTFYQIDKVVYNPETLLTNEVDFNYLFHDGIMGAFLSKEITLEDILSITKNKKYKAFMFGHGHMTMFYSKRQIVKTYHDYMQVENQDHLNYDITLKEAKRVDENYPLLEDDAGTHVFRGHVFETIEELDMLRQHIDYIVVDTIFKDDLYATWILPYYQENGKPTVDLKTINETYQDTFHKAFLHKESTIKGEIDD